MQRPCHQLAVDLKARRDPNCHPSKGPCETWAVGSYQVTVFLCQGMCGSNHTNSKIYSAASANFTIVD